jgi:DNA-binding transcriptional MerR regulator
MDRQGSNKITCTSKQGLLRISKLSEATGVPIPTLHFYTREGLLAPSLKTAKNMAYYSPDCIEDIRLIKDLQSQKYLPLSMIKWLLNAKHEGQNIDHLIEMRTLAETVFRPVVQGYKDMSLAELADATGLPESSLKQLEEIGLLMPSGSGPDKRYDDLDLRIAQIAGEVTKLGLPLSELAVYGDYTEAIRKEIKTLHSKMHALGLTGTVAVAQLMNSLNDLKTCLAKKTYRQFSLGHHD